jgi:ATP-dependent DNA ligase
MSTRRKAVVGSPDLSSLRLVVEVRYDHVTSDRFRHGTKLLRFRPDKPSRQCSIDQIIAPPRALSAGE